MQWRKPVLPPSDGRAPEPLRQQERNDSGGTVIASFGAQVASVALALNLGIRKTRKPDRTLHRRTSFHLWTLEALEFLRDHGGPENLAFLTQWGQGPYKYP
jgi:hypothetical protein